MADDLTDVITEAAQDPAEHTVDGVTTKARTIDEIIKADQHAKSEQALAAGQSAWGSSLRPARALPKWRE